MTFSLKAELVTCHRLDLGLCTSSIWVFIFSRSSKGSLQNLHMMFPILWCHRSTCRFRFQALLNTNPQYSHTACKGPGFRSIPAMSSRSTTNFAGIAVCINSPPVEAAPSECDNVTWFWTECRMHTFISKSNSVPQYVFISPDTLPPNLGIWSDLDLLLTCKLSHIIWRKCVIFRFFDGALCDQPPTTDLQASIEIILKRTVHIIIVKVIFSWSIALIITSNPIL